MSLFHLAKQLGVETCIEFDPSLLVPQQRVRESCFENKCGNYGNNYMCPPHVGSLYEITDRLQKFQRGVLLQYSQPLNVTYDLEGLRQSKLDFHNKVLNLENSLREKGIRETWGMIGGNCALCDFCRARTVEPCPHPEHSTIPAAIGRGISHQAPTAMGPCCRSRWPTHMP
jgi:predicted metal-binding protein